MLFVINTIWISFAWKGFQAVYILYLNKCAPVFQIVDKYFDPFLKLYVCVWTYLNENEVSVILLMSAVVFCLCTALRMLLRVRWTKSCTFLPVSLKDVQARHYDSQFFTITELTYSSLHEKIYTKQTNDRLSSSTAFFCVLPFSSYAQTPFTDIFLSSWFYFTLYINMIAVNGVICSCNPLVPS